MAKHKEEEEAINFGRSLIVPSVQEIAKQTITDIPPRYVQRQLDQDHISHHHESVPIIDLYNLFSNASGSELNKLHTASKEWGFFQVTYRYFLIKLSLSLSIH